MQQGRLLNMVLNQINAETIFITQEQLTPYKSLKNFFPDQFADLVKLFNLPGDDGSHLFSFSRDKGQFIITVRGVPDITLERLALKERGDMFEEIYGLKPVLRRGRPTKELMGDG